MQVEYINIDELKPFEKNPKVHTEEQIKRIVRSIREFGWANPILALKENKMVIAGHARLKAARQMNLAQVLVILLDMPYEKAIAYVVADNRLAEIAEWDNQMLLPLLDEIKLAGIDTTLIGFDIDILTGMDRFEANEIRNEAHLKLKDKFIIPPFSVLDTRQGYWQDRKKTWMKLGLESHLGRGENELGFSETCDNAIGRSFNNEGGRGNALTWGISINGTDPANPNKGWTDKGKRLARAYAQDIMKKELTANQKSRIESNINNAPVLPDYVKGGCGLPTIAPGTSIFDPVLCEIAYRWFCFKNGRVLDPFAGGSVRGIVAGELGIGYIGVDLRQEQIDANIKQRDNIIQNKETIQYICGDSRNIDNLVDGDFDLIFTCPPYFDLEVYSDNKNDISNCSSYQDFIEVYNNIIKKSVIKLKDDRFAVFVVGDIRDSKGFYRNFVSDTIYAFLKAGMMLYNEAILVNVAGSLPIRVNNQFGDYRKLGKMHQNVLVFYKGNTKNIRINYGEIEVHIPEGEALNTT